MMLIGLLIVSLIGVVLVLKPQTEALKNQDNNSEKLTIFVPPKTTDLSEAQSSTHRQKPLQNQQQWIEKRDQLYERFQEITTNLSQGQAVDQREISKMLEQQYQLVQVGVVQLNEAISYLEFLQKVIPEMDRTLDAQIAKIEKLEK